MKRLSQTMLYIGNERPYHCCAAVSRCRDNSMSEPRSKQKFSLVLRQGSALSVQLQFFRIATPHLIINPKKKTFRIAQRMPEKHTYIGKKKRTRRYVRFNLIQILWSQHII